MPRKTKKEKVIAEYRRKMQTVDNRRLKVDFEDRGLKVDEKNQASSFQSQNPSSILHHPSSNLVKEDLKKTLILSTLAISLEFVLYWLIELR